MTDFLIEFLDISDLILIIVLYIIAGYFIWLRFKHNL